MMAKKGFVKVANKNDLKEGGLLRVEPEGKPVALAMVEGKVYAVDATCTHEGGPLDEGKLEGHELTCPWHYAVYDVRNGKVSDKTVWATSLNSYPVQVAENGDISISLQGRMAQAEETAQRDRQENIEASQKKYYEEEERKADKLVFELLSKEKLQGTDIITFKLARGKLDYVAGQYAFFKLDGVSGDAKGPIRHFSIASSPTEQDLLFSTRIRETPYKQKLASLENGTKIQTWGPEGEFVLHHDHSKPAIVMFDSNRNESNILYKKEFDDWAAKNKNLKIIYTITEEGESKQDKSSQWKGEHGRIDKSMMARHINGKDLENSIFYVCGPPGMIKAMREMLQDVQIPKERIKVEEFTGY
jgi:nitrite reductase/ring-hydroxylating ferredoxin subunit/ferredoxin-NADP reductase